MQEEKMGEARRYLYNKINILQQQQQQPKGSI